MDCTTKIYFDTHDRNFYVLDEGKEPRRCFYLVTRLKESNTTDNESLTLKFKQRVESGELVLIGSISLDEY